MSKLQITFSVRFWSPDHSGFTGTMSQGEARQVFTSWRALYREIADGDIHRNDLTVRPDYAAVSPGFQGDRRSGAWIAEFVKVDGSRGQEILVDRVLRAETPGV